MLTVQPAPAPATAPAKPAANASAKERRAFGKALRAEVPLGSHADFQRPAAARDPLALLVEQGASRVPELLPIRYGRMVETPFTYFRGSARVMAADLTASPRSGLAVQMCGDAHLSNFGLSGSPERRLIFDVNDFDETLPGPFEYDVKRLVASLVVAGRANGFSGKKRRAIAVAAGARYRAEMAAYAAARDIDVWYSHVDSDELLQQLSARLDAARRKRLVEAFARARSRDSVQAFGKLTEMVDGHAQLRSQPPLIVPLRELISDSEGYVEKALREVLRQYRSSMQADHRLLLERYRYVDMARKVVGVGSVGTRCWVVLLTGRDDDDPLILQLKEATPSVHAEFVGRSKYSNQGQRVVAGQRLMQQASDIFLGWHRTAGVDGVTRDFYVRQLKDWKGSFVIEELRSEGLRMYGEVCAWSLARAHARSGDRIAIAGYLGSSSTFEEALAEFGETYADVTERDHRQLSEAITAGQLPAVLGT